MFPGKFKPCVAHTPLLGATPHGNRNRLRLAKNSALSCPEKPREPSRAEQTQMKSPLCAGPLTEVTVRLPDHASPRPLCQQQSWSAVKVLDPPRENQQSSCPGLAWPLHSGPRFPSLTKVVLFHFPAPPKAAEHLPQEASQGGWVNGSSRWVSR